MRLSRRLALVALATADHIETASAQALKTMTRPSALQIADTKVGTGGRRSRARPAVMHYTGCSTKRAKGKNSTPRLIATNASNSPSAEARDRRW